MDFRSTRLSDLLVRKTLSAAFVLGVAAFSLTAAEAQAQNDGTSQQVQYGDVDQLPGMDPSAAYSAYTYTSGVFAIPSDGTKVLCFYNPGSKKFLSIGGLWGTHASLNSSPHILWFESDSKGNLYIANNVTGSGTGNHVGITSKNEAFMDKGIGGTAGQVCAVTFVKSSNYTDTNKTYLVKLGDKGYLTAYPTNEDKLCNYQANVYTSAADYKNQEWKIITRDEYYQLSRTNPANMAAVVDFTFLLNSPDFRVNDTDIHNWKIGREDQNPDIVNKIMLGDDKMYSVYARVGSNDKNYRWVDTNTGKDTYNELHQQNYGKLFYCYAKGQHNFYLYQDITVHKAGWYVVRCNGFSTQQELNSKGGVHPLAYLFAAEVKKDASTDWTASTASTINLISRDDAKALTEKNDGTGAGQAFFDGEYDNQVQLCVEKAYDENGNEVEISEEHPATLRLGFLVDKYSNAAADLSSDDITAVDNFKLFYAGPRRNPELILDEDNDNMLYLSKATDEYKNSVLHLNRTFNDHKWNSLVLPVDLTCGQMKRTFGDGVKVARLEKITDNSIQFVTVEPTSDDDIMLNAFEPYIINPPVINTSSAAYTVDHFYTGSGDDNSQWLNKDCTGPSTDENDRFTLTIPQNHYTITMVSLDRTRFKNLVDTNNWVSQTNSSAEGSLGQLVCYGTMAKTYDSNGILPGRDDLTGDYFFYKGDIIQVPSDKQRGLQGFRCWFELKGRDLPAENKAMKLYIDGVADGTTTGIDEIQGPGTFTSRKRGLDGVYSLDGRLVRRGTSTEGLDKGIYITNGRKVVVR